MRFGNWRYLTCAPLLVACGGVPELGDEPATSETSSDTDTDTDTDTGETGGEELECDPAAFEYAPPPTTTVDGLPAVPIDILDVDAQMSFSFEGKHALVDATLIFQVGEQGGMPLFGLRQDILAAELDGQSFEPALLARHDFGLGEDVGFRVVEQELEPCSVHTLRLGYALLHPQGGPVDGFEWLVSPPGLSFSSKFQEDFGPSLYLDSWLPANLPFDRHRLSISLVLEAAPAAHRVITNGELEELAEHQWQLEFGPETTSMSPYFAIAPADPITTASGVHQAANGQAIPYDIHHDGAMSVECQLEACESELLEFVDLFVSLYGPYPHPALTVHASEHVTGEHYAGLVSGRLLNNLLINLSHQWWGTGVFAARYTDAWIEEGWTLYSIQDLHTQEPFEWDTEEPFALVDPHPFARSRSPESLNYGRRVFAGLATIVGPEEVPATMAEIYEQLAPLGSLSTAELERAFYCLNGEQPDVRRAFWRYVYGFDGEPEPPPADYCD